MASKADDLGISVGQWNALVRRARIGRERKAAALVLSSYARADGTRIHCGVARLAVDLEVSYSTARRYLAWLREAGLIELVRAGSRRRALSDEYRLILGPDVLETIEVLAPDEHAARAEGIREVNREASRVRTRRSKECASALTLDERRKPVDNSPAAEPPDGDLRSSRVSVENRDLRSNGTPSALTLDEPPSPLRISPSRSISPKTGDGDLRTDLAVVAHPDIEEHRRSSDAVVVEIFPGASQEAPYRPRPRWTTRGQATIAEAMARVAAERAAHRAAKEAT